MTEKMIDEDFSLIYTTLCYLKYCYFNTFCKGQVAQQKEIKSINQSINLSLPELVPNRTEGE